MRRIVIDVLFGFAFVIVIMLLQLGAAGFYVMLLLMTAGPFWNTLWTKSNKEAGATR